MNTTNTIVSIHGSRSVTLIFGIHIVVLSWTYSHRYQGITDKIIYKTREHVKERAIK